MSNVGGRVQARAAWLTRPGAFQRFGNVVAGVILMVCGFGAMAMGALTLAVWWALPYFVLAGIMFSGPRRAGARVRGGAVELHTVASCTRVPLDSVTRIHMGPHTAFVAIEHGAVTHELVTYGHQSSKTTDEMFSNSRDLGRRLGVPVLEYSDVESYVDGVRPKRRAGWSLRGFLYVLRWPEVWVTTLLAAVLLLPLMGLS